MWTVYRVGEDGMTVALESFDSCRAANKYADHIEDAGEVDYGQHLIVRNEDGAYFADY